MKILLVDNDEDFLKLYSLILDRAGHQVTTASSVERARQIVHQSYFHLIILDVRMEDDEDEYDKTGLVLAGEPELEHIPKVIITNHPDYKDVREAIVDRIGREPYAVEYISKQDVDPFFPDAITKIEQKFLKINRNLELLWDNQDTINSLGLIGALEKDLPLDQRIARVEEFEDLLRKLFCSFDQVHILNKLWFRNEKICLSIQATNANRDRYYLVTCGRLEAVQNEARKFRELAPEPEEHHGTQLRESCRTLHYGANLWQLVGAEFNQCEPVRTIFGSNERKIKAVFKSLLEDTLAEWRKQSQPVPGELSLGKFYRTRFGIEDCMPTRENLREKILNLGNECIVQRLIDDLAFQENKLVITFPHNRVETLDDPTPYLYDDSLLPPVRVYLRNSPGELCLDTILFDPDARTWLTEFSACGSYPIWHEFTQLEAMIRFKLLENLNLPTLLYMENQLLRNQQGADAIGQGDLEPDMRKAVAAILGIRQISRELVGNDPIPYAICLFYQAASELLGVDLSCFRKEKDTTRLLYRVILMSLLSRFFTTGVPEETLSLTGTQLQYDEQAKIVTIGDRVRQLTDTEAEIFLYLYKNAGKICSRELTLKEGMRISRPTREQLNNYLSTNIDRIREKIEPDPKVPRYLITSYGKGIKLLLKPEENSAG